MTLTNVDNSGAYVILLDFSVTDAAQQGARGFQGADGQAGSQGFTGYQGKALFGGIIMYTTMIQQQQERRQQVKSEY